MNNFKKAIVMNMSLWSNETAYKSGFLLIVLLIIASTPEILRAQISITNAYTNLSFNQPVDFQFADSSSNEIFIVEREGVIHKMVNDPSVSQTDVVLDISGRVSTTGEGGLLGLAFHPDFDQQSEAYLYYTASNPFRTIIARYQVNASTGQFVSDSEEILLELTQPFSNHNGGQVRYGPDGYLYISLGDGGSGGDPLENGQDLTTLFGTILRIDINSSDPGLNYAIPPDNPFAGNAFGYREEIFAYGLRNPFRFSFDRQTGDLWAGDVGQNSFEEIDIIKSGLNYGWNTMEASSCFDPSVGCDKEGLELPVFEYPRSAGQSVTGGWVYRGQQIPQLFGAYIYGDFSSGNIWSFNYDGSSVSNQQLLGNLGNSSVVAFGEDQQGELFICSFDGNIYTLQSESTTDISDENELPQRVLLNQNFPNPFNPSTTIRFSIPQPQQVSLTVYNSLGKEVAELMNGRLGAGSHSISFRGDNLSSGIYYYTLTTETMQLTKTMTLIK